MRFLLFLALCAGCALGRQTDYCFVNEDDPYLQFAAKTAYTFANGGKFRYQSIPNCKAQQIWMLARHGARYPTAETMTKLMELLNLRDQILNNHENRGDGRLCNEDLQNLRRWSLNSNVAPDRENTVTSKGLEESKLLARRIQAAFPDLLQPFPDDINSQNYVFSTAKSVRTKESMEAFKDGMFGPRSAGLPTSENDNLLKAYKNCSRWLSGDEDDPSKTEERDKFLSGPEFSDLIHNVSQRLGFQYDLSADTMRAMYDMCRFDKAWTVEKLSPWCAVFNKDELKILEYAEDLEYYYGTGYGREVNNVIGCFPLQDMYNRFREIEHGDTNSKPRATFYFTHSIPLMSFLRSLGVAKDSQPLLASNYRDMARRLWRTSYLGPFNSNFLAVFYRCGDTESPNKVMFYLQEKPLTYEGCQVGLCDWEYLKNRIRDTASRCGEEYCWRSAASTINQTLILFVTTLAFTLASLK